MQSYKTWVHWLGARRGHIELGNGPQMDFAAPPDAHGAPGVLTPEDAFVAAINTCVHMMFIWSCERLKIDLVSYDCEAEGFKLVRLNRTEQFVKVILRPKVVARGCEKRQVERALTAAQKYSLVAESIKSEIVVEPEIEIIA
jgi:organic hydroperoxide reductase OsmC/OhrA